MVCSRCKAPIREGARFCTKCGAPVIERPQARRAPSPPYNAPRYEQPVRRGEERRRDYYEPVRGSEERRGVFYEPEKPKKNRHIGLIIGISAAVLLLIIGVVLFLVLRGGGKGGSAKNLAVGDTYSFGTYEQDNDSSNGTEPIEWQVLEKDGSRLLLISTKGLDGRVYHDTADDVTWETCSLRSWLNNDFLTKAFTSDEQNRIQTVTVTTEKDPERDTDPGNPTEDKIFVLSAQEAEKYFPSDSERRCEPTEYAKEQGVFADMVTGCSSWWLRSPGMVQFYSAKVFTDGEVFKSGEQVNNTFSVRPVLWLDTDA